MIRRAMEPYLTPGDRIGESRRLTRAAVSRDFKVPFAVPGTPTTAHFVGRASELSRMRKALPFSGRRETVILFGPGGIGKTQLAIEYAKRRKNDYTAVLWLDYMNEASLHRSFAILASRLGYTHPSPSADISEVVNTVLRWLNHAGNKNWLLIIDNANASYTSSALAGFYDVQRSLPSIPHGHVVMATRSSQLRIGRRIKLERIHDIDDCLKILQTACERPEITYDKETLELVKKLDGIPLAIWNVGRYLSQVPISLAEYLERYDRSCIELEQSAPLLPVDRTLKTTWQISQRQVAAISQEAYQLLRLWRFFDSQDIWYRLLEAGKDHGPEWFTTVTKNKFSFDQNMKILCDYGLAEPQQEPVGYTMHSCVHDWVRRVFRRANKNADDQVDNDIDKDVGDKGAKLALRCISLAVPNSDDIESRVVKRRLLNHANSWLERYGGQRLESEHFENLQRLGVLYEYHGKLAKAEALYIRAMKGQEKALGPEHLLTLNTVNSLANIYCVRGKPVKAKVLYKRVIKGQEIVLGLKHSSTLSIVKRLGDLYRDQDKLSEAEALYIWAIEGQEKVFGPEHSSTLDTVNSLASLYYVRGKLVEAEVLYKRALIGQETSLGLEHPSTLYTLYRLGDLYQDQGRLAEAEAFYLKALEGQKKALGPEHLLTLNTVNSLANLYRLQGRLAEANSIRKWVPEGKGKSMDRKDSFTLSTVYDLDNTYNSHGRPGETENSDTLVGREQASQRRAVGTESSGFSNYPYIPGLCDDSLVQSLMKADETDIESQVSFQQTSQSEIEDGYFCDLLCRQEVLLFLYKEVTVNGLQAKTVLEENIVRALKKLYIRNQEFSTRTEGYTDLPFLKNRLRRRKIALRIADRIVNSKLPIIEEESGEKPEEDGEWEPEEEKPEEEEVEEEEPEEGELDKVKLLRSIGSDDSKKSDEDGQVLSDRQSSYEELPIEYPRPPSFLKETPVTANINRVLTENGTLDQFLIDLCLNFLPPHLRFVMENVPITSLEVIDRERWSAIDSIKLRINKKLDSEWTWKAWKPELQPIQSGYRRLILHCRCRQKLTRDVPIVTAEILQTIIRLRRSSEPTTENWLAKIPKGFIQAMSPSIGQSTCNTQSSATRSATSSRYIPATTQNQPLQSVTNAHLNNPTSQTGTSSTGQPQVLLANDLWLVLGYQGSRPTLEIEHISISDGRGDIDCCSELKRYYHRHRGFWRRWFSIWELDSCQFVKFDKICVNAVTYHPDEWPQGHIDYELEPSYPRDGPPPISESHFRMYLDLCETAVTGARCCSWHIFHECMAGTFSNSRWLIKRVPKKRSRFDYQQDNSDKIAWGLRPVLRPSVPRVIYYYIVIITGPFIFWWIWLSYHPQDLQTAGVPLALAASFISMFWAIKDALYR